MRLLAFSLLALAATHVQAIALVGERGGGCADVTSGSPSQVIPITNTVTAGDFLVVAAATTSNITFVSMTDTQGNTYTPDNSIAPGLRTFTVSAPALNALSNADSVTITYSNISGTETSCVGIAEFSGIQAPSSVDVAGGGSGTGTSLSATLGGSTSQANELIFANFAFNAPGGSGGVGVPPPGQTLNLRCNGTNTFCLIPAYEIVSMTGSFGLAANTGNSVDWGGVVTAYREGATTPVHLTGFEVQ